MVLLFYFYFLGKQNLVQNKYRKNFYKHTFATAYNMYVAFNR